MAFILSRVRVVQILQTIFKIDRVVQLLQAVLKLGQLLIHRTGTVICRIHFAADFCDLLFCHGFSFGLKFAQMVIDQGLNPRDVVIGNRFTLWNNDRFNRLQADGLYGRLPKLILNQLLRQSRLAHHLVA